MPPPTQSTFKALADPTRRGILAMLRHQDMTIGDVAAHFDMTRPAIAKHLAILEDGALIRVTPRGRERVNALNSDGFRAAQNWFDTFDTFWDDRLSVLKTAIEKDT